MTTRAQRFAGYFISLTLLWLMLSLDVLPLPLVSQQVKADILPTIPWWVLVSTGSYLVWNIGWGIFNFNDVPKAYDELMLDIKRAKDYLGARGVDVS